ncbi:aldo/keto reductase family protein [Actinomadura montaniterrae]|uniref:Aldo/keto reductase n=1 Tax=Actinomadura montaniterrae TaxID=1803903 RepID=A0A6L3W511_9ACTN|nr:aldo/keto reductase family protein [Actinomadura montaniterrae]KAB2390039.1 aldo/keto reductase [Actinomadura montaniterrae]
MQFAPLGSSGLVVSRIAYGNSLTHGDQVDDETAALCLKTALDAGVNFLDTADVYAAGRAEEVLGRLIAGLRREDLVIATKVGRSKRPGPNEGRLSRKHVMESINASLRRLGTDYVDLYQAHRYDAQTPLRETMQAFADLVRAGKVLYVGVSEWPAGPIREAAALAAELGVPLVSNQPQYSLLWRVIEEEVIPACDELGVSQVAWAPLAGGVLTGKYAPGGAAPDGTRAASKGGAMSIGRWDYLNDIVLTAVRRLAPIAAEAGLTLPRLALAWVLRNPSVASAVVGASRPEQLTETLAAVDEVLGDDLVERIEAAVEPAVRRDPRLTEDPLGPASRLTRSEEEAS